VRTFSLPAYLRDILVEHLARHGDPSNPDAMMFGGLKGELLLPDVFRHRPWPRALRKAGLDETRTPHNLRDTFVTQAVADGFTESEIMAIGGWESATVMRTRYRGLFESSLWEHGSAADARMRQAMAETPLETPVVRLLALERE
jgi:integrase